MLGGLPFEEDRVTLPDLVLLHTPLLVLVLLHLLLRPPVLLPRLRDVLPALCGVGPEIGQPGVELPVEQELRWALLHGGVRRGAELHQVLGDFEVGVLPGHLRCVEDLLDVPHEGLHQAGGLGVLGASVCDVLDAQVGQVLLE